MSTKTIAIICAAFAGGVIAIGIAMSAGSGWEPAGTYVGVSNAAHMVNNSSNCYAFQTGCNATSYGSTTTASDYSGAALSGSYGGP
jgi:hypothetical protein